MNVGNLRPVTFYLAKVIRESAITGDPTVEYIDIQGRTYPRIHAPHFASPDTAWKAAKKYLSNCDDTSKVLLQTVALREEIICNNIVPPNPGEVL